MLAAHASQVELSFDWSQPAHAGLVGRCLRELRPVVADEVRAEPDYRDYETTRGIRSELDVPVVVHGERWGAINLESDQPAAFDEQDIRLMDTVAELLGSALGSAALYDRLERAYLGTAEALSAALEAKDSYTASHSHGIVSRAEAVGRLMGMEEAELRKLRLGRGVPRHRQAGHPRGDAQQARLADRRGARAAPAAHGHRASASSRRWSSSPTFCRWCATLTSAGTATATPTAWPARTSRWALASSSPATPGTR